MSDVVEDVALTMAEVNIGLLHEQLRAALGDVFLGVSTGQAGRVRVHVRGGEAKASEAVIASVVAAHDARAESKAQAEERERRASVGRLRKPFAQWTAADKDEYLRLLVLAGVGLEER